MAIVYMTQCPLCQMDLMGISYHDRRLILYWHPFMIALSPRCTCPMKFEPYAVIGGEMVVWTGIHAEYPWKPQRIQDIKLPEPTIEDLPISGRPQ